MNKRVLSGAAKAFPMGSLWIQTVMYGALCGMKEEYIVLTPTGKGKSIRAPLQVSAWHSADPDMSVLFCDKPPLCSRVI